MSELLSASITGTFPRIQSDLLTKGFHRASDYMLDSILKNLEQGGRPNQWEVKAGGNPSFLGGPNSSVGKAMMNNWGNDFAEAGETVKIYPYIDILNFGGTIIQKTSPQARFFWAMYYETGDEKFKWMALANRHGTVVVAINIPKREFIVWQEVDSEVIDKILKNELVIYFNSHQERIQ